VKIVANRSVSDRGLSAETMPTGNAIRSIRTMPPKTSEAVTGAAEKMMSLTSCRFANDVPSDRSMTSRFMNS
jgi:hypothetical protein